MSNSNGISRCTLYMSGRMYSPSVPGMFQIQSFALPRPKVWCQISVTMPQTPSTRTPRTVPRRTRLPWLPLKVVPWNQLCSSTVSRNRPQPGWRNKKPEPPINPSAMMPPIASAMAVSPPCDILPTASAIHRATKIITAAKKMPARRPTWCWLRSSR